MDVNNPSDRSDVDGVLFAWTIQQRNSDPDQVHVAQWDHPEMGSQLEGGRQTFHRWSGGQGHFPSYWGSGRISSQNTDGFRKRSRTHWGNS